MPFLRQSRGVEGHSWVDQPGRWAVAAVAGLSPAMATPIRGLNPRSVAVCLKRESVSTLLLLFVAVVAAFQRVDLQASQPFPQGHEAHRVVEQRPHCLRILSRPASQRLPVRIPLQAEHFPPHGAGVATPVRDRRASTYVCVSRCSRCCTRRRISLNRLGLWPGGRCPTRCRTWGFGKSLAGASWDRPPAAPSAPHGIQPTSWVVRGR
jgi:hypothetical protein